MDIDHCPESGKIYVLILFCIVFTGILTSINVTSKTETNYQLIDDNLFGTGVAINIIQTIFTLFLIGVDIFGKWLNFPKIGYAKYPIILLSSAYMLGFGIINVFQSGNSNDTEQDLSMISIASFIAGVIGMLYISSDIVCSVGCRF
jgi:hypothetical protein